MTTNTVDLNSELQQYGIPASDIKSLRRASPELLDYLDLIPRSNQADDGSEATPHCVVERNEHPLLFVVSESLFDSPLPDPKYHRLCHTLACRGQHSYLAILRTGELHVFPVENDGELKAERYEAGTAKALSFFPRLISGHCDGSEKPHNKDFVFYQMRSLLTKVAEDLSDKAYGLERTDILSLVGRALFFRFLCDRKIISKQDVAVIASGANSLEDCFDGVRNVADTCQWLDRTFNGNFLPLSEDLFNRIERQNTGHILSPLSAISHAYDPAGTRTYQTRLRFEHWTDFNFAHVPIGLLSQVYEYFAHQWDPHARMTSVHYTPRNIASTLVEMVFQSLPDAHKPRILDPACGAGVFLVLAFRRLYRERWKATGKRPITGEIRQILMDQLRGFDISDAALKLAALSLYLTAIELDPNPTPAEKLRFKDLQNHVLFYCRPPEDSVQGQILGSLSPQIGNRFDGQCDIVLSNPPWTAIKDADIAKDLDRISKQIVERRSNQEIAKKYHNPQNSPDLPFLWKSMEWCRPGGRIAMALPSRILLKQEDLPCISRETVFRLLEVNGIINCSNLSETHVWPDMKQPFMLLLATNQLPAPRHALHYIAPYLNENLNKRGELWIDAEATVPISPPVSFEEHWLWKGLAIGTSLDIEVIRKIKALSEPTLKEYWDDLGLLCRAGYGIKGKPDQLKDATALQVLPDLSSTRKFRFRVNTAQLKMFSHSQLRYPLLLSETDKHFKGDPLAVYRAPLVLIKEAPGTDRAKGRALLSHDDVAYNASFHGYSAQGHSDADLLARYVHLFVHSDIWMYYALMTSPKLGAERNALDKSNFDNCPFVPLENVSLEMRERLVVLSRRLTDNDTSVFNEIDTFFAELYGLDALDLQVIRDTLDVGLPFAHARKRANDPPSEKEKERFREQLETSICPFFAVKGTHPHLKFWHPIGEYALSNNAAYSVLLLGTKVIPDSSVDKDLWLQIVEIASANGATRIFHEIEGGLAIALVNQYRYWTPTRTRLCCSEILRRFMQVF